HLFIGAVLEVFVERDAYGLAVIP
ncbi:MAG: hypothetical protein QG656_965, partial [Candidatus Hydrogenedentes bacterium]|nr:hypothetical protein [Candidatus Hydrogenedentota bacterium]